MEIIDAHLLDTPGDLKFIMNESGIAFFSVKQQHRDVKTHGLSYEDEYKGNAVAGIVSSERVEIRYHSAFSDDHIRRIWSRVIAAGIPRARLGKVLYQGREIAVA